MSNDVTIAMLKQLIKEVKEENKGKVISESKQPVTTTSEEKELKTFVAKSVVDALRKAEK